MKDRFNAIKYLKLSLIGLGRPIFHGWLFVLFGIFAISVGLLRGLVYSIKLISGLLNRAVNRAAFLHGALTHLLQFRAGRVRFPLVKFLITAVLIGTVGGACFGLWELVVKDLPNPDRLEHRDQIISTKIFDRNGDLLYKIFKNENRTLVNLENIPLEVRQATIAIEDRDFYEHAGYSYRGILRAIRHTLFEGRLEGGSTITQQLVKNALLSREQTLQRKIKEVILAILVETRFSKDDILTMYFNEVSYGGATYGIEEASQLYFGKSVTDLTLAEAALIAGLPAAPTRYSPFGTHPELAKFRQHEVLRRMVEDGYITADQSEHAKEDRLAFATQKTDIKAPHFVMYVKEILVDRFGEQIVEQGGLEVITSLDMNAQTLAEQAVAQEVGRLGSLNITNGASLVTIPQTGEILAMVGSKDFYDFEHDGQVNVTLSPRQPGSAIKPVNYAVALENGFTAATMLSDSPITYQIPGQPPYTPRNYDGTFHGRVTLRDALANSYNVPAVKTLSVFGVDKMLEKGRTMGITTWEDSARFGLSLTLGGGEVTMTDLAAVYGVLANGGTRVDLNPILSVTDYRGRLLYRNGCTDHAGRINGSTFLQESASPDETCTPKRILTPEISFILTDILSDNKARTPAFGAHSALNIQDHEVAVKTGTTQNLRDNWTIGYTKDLLVATWVGNNDNAPMSYVASGLTGASPIWNTIISGLLADRPAHRFEPPTSVEQVAICPSTGTLPCETCPGRLEYFIPTTQPSNACLPEMKDEQNVQEEVTIESLKTQARRNRSMTSFESMVETVLKAR